MHLNRPTIAIWATTLLAAGFAANLFFMCGTNLVAFSVLAATTLGLRRGSLVALGVWLESQLLGFTVLGYPHASITVAWGLVLGAAALFAATVAGACASRGSIVAFATAFLAYELSLATFAVASGSGLSAFTPSIVGQLLLSNAAFAAGGLVLFRIVLIAQAGVVSAFARTRQT